MLMKSYYNLVTLISLTTLINGCSLYKAPEVKPIKTPSNFKENLQIRNTLLENEWWKNFHDENLNHLINSAIQNNLRYQIALQNIKVAHTFVTESNINRLPELNVGVNTEGFNFGNNSLRVFNIPVPNPNPNVGFDYLYGSVAYELDIWHQKSNITHIAEVNKQISQTESRKVQLTLISEIVNTYFQIKTLNTMLINFSRQLQIDNERLKIARTQYAHGYTNKTTVDSARSAREQVIGNLSMIRKECKLYTNHLAYLLGEYPEQFNYEIKPLIHVHNFRSLIPPTVPAEVLGNRPDVQRAFLKILSYGYLQKETLADFLPHINLFGYYGNENFSISSLVQSSALGIYGFNVIEQITGIARNFSRYKRTKVLFAQATLNYKDTVLNAFQEVNNALVAYNEDSRRLISQRNIIKYTFDQLKTARLQYKSGAIDYNTYLQVELSLLQNEYNLDKQNMIMYRDVIQIYKVLGVGVYEVKGIKVCCRKVPA